MGIRKQHSYDTATRSCIFFFFFLALGDAVVGIVLARTYAGSIVVLAGGEVDK